MSRRQLRKLVPNVVAASILACLIALWTGDIEAFQICKTVTALVGLVVPHCIDDRSGAPVQGHYEITRDGLGQVPVNLRPSQQAIEEAANADELLDASETTLLAVDDRLVWLVPSPSYDARHHFDRPIGKSSADAWTDSLAYLSSLRNATVALLSAPNACQNVPTALSNIGRAIHSIQDAYAHSNYTDPYSLSGLTAPDQQAFDAALQNPGQSSLVSSSLLLTEYSKVFVTDPENPDGTCSQSLPPGPSNYCHRYFAKDTPDRAFGPSGYDAAYQAAQAATTAFVQGIASIANVQWQTVVTYKTAGDVCHLQPPPPPTCPSSALFGGVVAGTFAFDSDISGRSQVCTQDVDSRPSAINPPTPITSGGGGQQQAQEPQWSLAASSSVDSLGRIAYQFGAPGVRGIHVAKPDGTGDVQLTPPFNSIIAAGPQKDAHYPCADARDPSWSPDGRFIAYACLSNTQTTSNYDIWIHAIRGGTLNDPDFDYPLLTLSSSLELRPAWSPDGTKIAFVTNARGFTATGPNSKIAVVQVVPAVSPVGPGGGVPFVQPIGTYSILTDDVFTNFSPTWAPDSRAIGFSSTRTGGRDIYRMSATYGTNDLGTFVRLTTNAANDSNPAWSPDGRTIMFASDRSGTNQIYVMSALLGEADTANFHRITNDSANENDPTWTPHVTAPQNLLTVVVPGVIVTSGVAAPTGSGTVTVSDGFGNVVSGAVVTIIPPSTGSGTLAFAPSSGLTDQAGGFAFVAAEPTLQAPADYQFTVNVFDSSTGRSGFATPTIRVGGSAPPLPGQIPVPPQVRLPVGQPVFRPQTKVAYAQTATAKAQEGLIDSAFGILLSGSSSGSLGPLSSSIRQYLGPALFAYELYHLQGIAYTYVETLKYLILANDPPDPNFGTVAVPTFRAPIAIVGSGGPLSISTLALMNQRLGLRAAVDAYLDALAISINRYSTALSAGDTSSASLQRNAVLAYEDTLAILLQHDASVARRLITSFQQDGLPNVQLAASDAVALQNVVATNGLPNEMVQILLQLGLTSGDIAAIQNSLLGAAASSLTGNLIASLQLDAGTSETTSVTFAQSSPAVPLLVPTITIAGGTLAYDGRPHGATVTATGVGGAPVRGLFSVTYAPGGATAPVSIGTYTVSAQFTSTDPNYTNASGTGTITITNPTPVQTVTPAGGMQFSRVSHQATPLANGLVLASGGQSNGTAIAQAELFNPGTSSWSVTGNNVIPRFDHSATLLQDGRVLVAGGVSAVGDCSSNATSETYDPARGRWSLTGRLPFPVGTGHIAIRLLDGRVLVSGGGDRCGTVFRTAALFDPSTNTWSATSGMTLAREFHSAALLQDGRVLVAGGVRGSPLTTDPSAEIYDPTAGTWTAVASMGTPRQTSCNGYVQPYLAALSDGSILAAGGFFGPTCSSFTPQRTVTGVTVAPSSVQFAALGRTQSLTVTAQRSDGSTQLFTGPLQFGTADAAVASVDASGVITATGVGTTTITATPSGFPPVGVTTTVETAHLTAISVSPPAISFIGSGQTQLLAINGQLSDGSQQSVSTGLTFSSSNAAVAGVDPTGLITSGANGLASITVSTPGVPAVLVAVAVKSLTSIAPSPASVTLIGLGQTRALVVTGQYSDGSQQTLTSGLSFTSSDPSIARVDLSGNITSMNNGTATITVAASNVPAVSVVVTVKSLTVIALLPSTFTLSGAGTMQALTVIGTYSDASTAALLTGVTFSSSDVTVASVSASGVVTSVGSGAATVTATFGSLQAAHATITVVDIPMEADAVPFSVLNLAGITGGQPVPMEADGRPFSILNTAGNLSGQPISMEADARAFSVLNTAINQVALFEADASNISVLNRGGIGALPDLAISVTASPNPVPTGATLTYAVTVRNIGNLLATGVLVSDALPPSMVFQSCSVPCTISNSVVTVDLGVLVAGATVTFNIVATAPVVSAPSSITNTAAVSNTIPESDTTNNQVSLTMTVQANQSINFGALSNKTFGDPPFGVSAIATSGLAVGFSGAGTCTVSNAVVTITGAGTCTITASQGGDGNYNAAPNVSQSFAIARANQTIAFGPVPVKSLDDAPFQPSAAASSGLPVSFAGAGGCTVSSNMVVLTAAQSCTVTASQAGNGNYNSAPAASQTFTVNPSQSLPPGSVPTVVVDPLNSSTVFAGTYGGVFKSVNGALTWTRMGLSAVNALAFDPTNTATLYAATDVGVYKTMNGGQTWVSRSPPSFCSRTVAVDPLAPQTVYSDTCGSGAYKSTNGGLSWAASGLSGSISALAVDPANSSTVYAGTSSGVFKSTNGGQNWTAVSSGVPQLNGVSMLAIDPANSTTIYAAAGSALFKSIDGGQSWSLVNSGLQGLGVSNIDIDPVNPSTLYAAIRGSSGAFKSTNGGLNWVAADSGLSGPFLKGLHVAVDRTNTTTLYLGTEGYGVFKSENGGVDWFPVSYGINTVGIGALAVDSADTSNVYVGLRTSGIFKSSDGGSTWTRASSGIGDGAILALAVDPTSSIYAGGAISGGLWKSADGGQNWNAVQPSASYPLAIDPVNAGTLYAGGGGRVFKTTDAGQSWTFSNPFASFLGGENVLAIDPVTPTTIYATAFFNGGVFKSTDGGQTWTATNQGLTTLFMGALVIDPVTPTTIYAGARAGAGGLFKSSDGGQTWARLPAFSSGVFALAIDRTHPGTVYAGGGGIFKTTDGGQTSTFVGAGLNTSLVYSLTVDPSNSATIFAGTANGVFKTTDSGATWQQISRK